MSFHLSPASLVDQRGIDLSSLLLSSNSTLSSTLQAYGNFSVHLALNDAVPQIFVVNPASDNVFRHVDYENAHAAIIGLIYFSMWMGALGWDIVSTASFDIRVIRETNWYSSFSGIYSIAYLLSRYVSLSWLITVVTNSVIMTDRCDAWMKGSTALFSVAISATMLVFCLRTCSIWHMKQKVVSLVVSAWLVVVAFAVLLPVMSYGTQLPTSNFCSWHFNGLYVVGVFGALLIFDLLCLLLTVCKLNKAGWRGLLHGLFPSSRHNLDAEDVKTMLVQKTTAFFAIQFLFLISALLVYVLTTTYAFRMMNIVASVAVASSMAGRIFRRAWRQTRELAPHNINRPPSYFPAWAEEHPDAAVSRNDVRSAISPSDHPTDGGDTPANVDKDQLDSLAFYVEGEFGPQLKARSMSNPSLRSMSRLPSALAAPRQLRDIEAGRADPDANADAISITSSTIVIARENIPRSNSHGPADLRRGSLGSQIGPAPAYSRRLGSAASSRPRTGDQVIPVLSRPPRRTSSSDAGSALPALTNLHATSSSASVRLDERPSTDRRQAVMEEKRRTYLTSPPLSAGFKPSKKDVYDVDSVKAAARLGARQARPSASSSRRPATAESLAPGQNRVPRPKTAPNLPSSSISPPTAETTEPKLESEMLSKSIQVPIAASITGSASAADDDVLLAFLNTVEQDSRERGRSDTQNSGATPANSFASSSFVAGERRPGTSRGNTASSSKNDDLAEDAESDLSTVHGHDSELRGRRASSSARPRTGLTPQDSSSNNGGQARASSSAGPRSRSGTSDGSSSGRRPSTAIGDAVKPFGFGTFTPAPRRGSQAHSSHGKTSAISDDEEGDAEADAEAVLGSVIEREYAKLAARAGVSPDLPC